MTRAAEKRRELDPGSITSSRRPSYASPNLEAQARARSCSVQSVPGLERRRAPFTIWYAVGAESRSVP